jgi:hypothetical protein
MSRKLGREGGRGAGSSRAGTAALHRPALPPGWTCALRWGGRTWLGNSRLDLSHFIVDLFVAIISLFIAIIINLIDMNLFIERIDASVQVHRGAVRPSNPH